MPKTYTYRDWPEEVDWIEDRLRLYASAIYNFSPNEMEEFVGMMLGIAYYESRGKWYAVNGRVYSDPYSQACGTFQHLPKYWSAQSRPSEGEPKVQRPQRVEATIDVLRAAGLEEDWMDNPHTLYPLPKTRIGLPLSTGIRHKRANIAVAVWLWGFQGYGAWSPTHSHFKPEDFVTGETLWTPDLGTYINVSLSNPRPMN